MTADIRLYLSFRYTSMLLSTTKKGNMSESRPSIAKALMQLAFLRQVCGPAFRARFPLGSCCILGNLHGGLNEAPRTTVLATKLPSTTAVHRRSHSCIIDAEAQAYSSARVQKTSARIGTSEEHTPRQVLNG